MPRPSDDRLMWEAFSGLTEEKHEQAMLEAYEKGEVTKEQLIEEGIWDRLRARGAGAAAGAGTFMKNLGKAATGITTGGTVTYDDPNVAYTQQKLASIIGTFQKEMASLFGKEWATTYPRLAQELQATLDRSAGASSAVPPPVPAEETPPPPPAEATAKKKPARKRKPSAKKAKTAKPTLGGGPVAPVR